MKAITWATKILGPVSPNQDIKSAGKYTFKFGHPPHFKNCYLKF